MLCYGPPFKWIDSDRKLKSATLSMTTTHDLHLRSSDRDTCFEFKFGFFMDDVEHVRNISTYLETFVICPDPIIYPFNNEGRRIQYRYDYLTIEGSNLLDVATINDYLITIGSYPCIITSISDQQIVCQPTNRTMEKSIRKKRILLDIQKKYNEQAIVRVSISKKKIAIKKRNVLFN